jgi:ribosomal protein S17
MEKKRGVRKTREGFVVSDKMDKTVVVEVKRLVSHPLYHKGPRPGKHLPGGRQGSDRGNPPFEPG